MNISCQIASILNGSLPMCVPAHCSSVSLEPPSPMPVIPMSVSTVQSMLLWLKRRLGCGRRTMRTLVILPVGSGQRPDLLGCGVCPSAAAACVIRLAGSAAAREERKYRRFMPRVYTRRVRLLADDLDHDVAVPRTGVELQE